MVEGYNLWTKAQFSEEHGQAPVLDAHGFAAYTDQRRQYDGLTVLKHFVIDGFEGDFARLEWGEEVLNLPRAWLPRAAAEGDHLRAEVKDDGLVCFEVDAAATRRTRQAIQARLDDLNAQDPGEEISL